MAKKNCLVYETLGKVSDLSVQQNLGNNEVRLSGVFGVCGVRNNNKRVYNKANYGMMVEALQKTIQTEGCPGELEHPNSMNITLENVSHKIESIEMHEDGTITGTILLLNTPKGQIAKAIVEGGLPLYISSRGAGSIDDKGNVTLSTIKTYDLVGTPGFSQAKLALKENQTYESLNESLDDGNIMYAIVENDEFGKDDSDNLLGDLSSSDDKEADNKKTDTKETKESDSKKADDKKSEDEPKEDEPKEDDNKQKTSDKVNMEDIKKSLDELIEKVSTLEAELHIAKESKEVNYDAIESWIKEEFAPSFAKDVKRDMKSWVMESVTPGIEKWITEEFAPEIQGWITEEFAPEIEGWVKEEFAPEIEGWVKEEFAPEIQGWITEEFAPEIQGWITEEFAPEIQGWITEEFAPEIENKINENVSEYLEFSKENPYKNIDKVLEGLENLTSTEQALKQLSESQKQDALFEGYYAIANMPLQYRPAWEMLSESRKLEIARQSRMYDFTKQGILESFWSSVKLEERPIVESVKQTNNITEGYTNSVIAQMMRLRKNS